MKPKYKKHIFVCTNERTTKSPRGDCASCGGISIRKRLVQLINQHDLKNKIRANKSGCLDVCELGPVIVVYPQNFWYTKVKLEDINEIFQTSIIEDMPVERLIANDETWKKLEHLKLYNKS